MPGLSLKVMGNVRATAPANSAPGGTVAEQAFGAGASSSAPSPANPLSPLSGHGARFWLGVAGVVALVWVYHSLPE